MGGGQGQLPPMIFQVIKKKKKREKEGKRRIRKKIMEKEKAGSCNYKYPYSFEM